MSGGNNAGYSPHSIYSFSIPQSGGYDGVGNLLSVTDQSNGVWNYTYDTLDRLQTGVTSSGSFYNQGYRYGCWAYSGLGNRTAEQWQSGSCPSTESGVTATASFNTSNHVTWTTVHAASSGFSYDGAGNVTSDNAYQYLYDGDGRICAVKNLTSGSLTAYIYDPEGYRVAKGTPSSFSCSISGISVTSRYIVGIGGEQLSEENSSGNWVHTNVFANGKLLATYEPSETYFAMNDWLGTKRAVVSADGTQFSTDMSLPYGNELATSGSAPDPSEHHFTGKERDAETGFANGNDYFWARYYASSMGTFLSPDWSAKAEPVPYAKLDNPQTLNLYAYVGNNPMIRFDADGHDGVADGMSMAATHDLSTEIESKYDHEQVKNGLLTTKSEAAIEQSKLDAKEAVAFEDAVIAAGTANDINPNLLVGLADKESGIDPTAVSLDGQARGLYQIRHPRQKDLGLSDEDVFSLTKVEGPVAHYLAMSSKALGGDWDLLIGSWRQGVGGIRTITKQSSDAMWDYVIEPAVTTGKHQHPARTLGDDYVNFVESFAQ